VGLTHLLDQFIGGNRCPEQGWNNDEADHADKHLLVDQATFGDDALGCPPAPLDLKRIVEQIDRAPDHHHIAPGLGIDLLQEHATGTPGDQEADQAWRGQHQDRRECQRHYFIIGDERGLNAPPVHRRPAHRNQRQEREQGFRCKL
jgi:hypothetical protein